MSYESAIRALADPTRRHVFERLRRGPLPVGKLAEGLRVTRPAVSQHLRVLERAGLVQARREGTHRIYRIELQGLDELRRYLDQFWDDVLESFRLAAARDAKEHEGRAQRQRRSTGGKSRARPRSRARG